MAEVTFVHSDEVRRVAARVMETVPEHAHLREANIAYLKRISSDNWTSKGHTVLAQIRKPSAVDHFLTDYDFVLTVNGLAWDNASMVQKEALIDHELCHVTADWSIAGHDLEEFVTVVRRHGLWREGLVKLVEAANDHGYDLQLSLPMAPNNGQAGDSLMIQSDEAAQISLRFGEEPQIGIEPTGDNGGEVV